MLSLPDTLRATHQICLYGLEHNFWIHSFRPTWHCLIIKVLATWVKFLQPSGYCSVINCAFTFHTRNVLGYFAVIMAQFELIEHKFPNYTSLHIYLCSFQITQWNNTQCVWAPTTLGIYHSLNCFGCMLYVLQTSIYQSTAKLLTPPCSFTYPFTQARC